MPRPTIITRDIQNNIQERLFQGKAIIIYGARQTGKTTLIKTIRSSFDGQSLYLNCDEIDIRQQLTGKTSTELASLIGNARLIIIDEAQRVEDIGLTTKILVDHFPDRQFLITGSSAFELSDRIKEPMTGRALEFHLFPFSLHELTLIHTELEMPRILEERILRGMYPEAVLGQDKDYTARLADSYLYKDILSWQKIRNHNVLLRLLQALALQIGQEVAYTELAGTLGIDKKTVENYVDILEKAFVIFRIGPFSRNLRTELKKNRKIYFCDTGIRNALINNFNPLAIRSDSGHLFENFIVSERRKRHSNLGERVNMYFWRTHQRQEIDLIEDTQGALAGFEIKLNREHHVFPPAFLTTYPGSELKLINRKNCLA